MTGADLVAAGGPLSKSDETLFASIKHGAGDGAVVMPPHAAVLSDGEIRATVAYLRERFRRGARAK